ncbi:MAG: GTP-binding protein [Candidatus Methanomethylophilaceae archaeon]
MIVYVLGGFLGSGKTTLLMRMASMYIKMGKTVTVLVNEMGEIGVDGTTIKSEGYNAVELPNGCICCSLSGELQSSVKNIKRDYDPDVMLVEPTGLALPHKVEEVIRTSDVDLESIEIMGIIDCLRFDLFLEKREAFFKTQIKYSDMILLNKMDVVTSEERNRIMSWISEEFQGIPVYAVSGKTGEGLVTALQGLKK